MPTPSDSQPNSETDADSGVPRGILRVEFADNAALYRAYMPFVSRGGLFLAQEWLGDTGLQMGSEVFLLLHLLAVDERLPVAGNVIWITPKDGGTRRPPGVGIQFVQQDNGRVRDRIETLLGAQLAAETRTDTL